MMKRTLIWLVLLALQGVVLLAQGADKIPKPTPEHKRLGYFVGKWTYEGEMKPSPFGPGGKVKTTDSCEWFSGGFSVVCHSDGTGPMGAMKGLGLLSYNAEEKKYVYFGVDNMGMAATSKGIREGDTWTYTGEDKMGGKLIKSRVIIKELSPTAYTFKFEMAEGAKWKTIMDGKETKK